MGISLSLVMIAVGAILTWAVTATVSGLDLTAVGVILMVVGFIVFVISLVLWRTWWGGGFWGGLYDEGPAPAGEPVVRRRVYRPAVRRRRTTYVEDEGPPPGL